MFSDELAGPTVDPFRIPTTGGGMNVLDSDFIISGHTLLTLQTCPVYHVSFFLGSFQKFSSSFLFVAISPLQTYLSMKTSAKWIHKYIVRKRQRLPSFLSCAFFSFPFFVAVSARALFISIIRRHRFFSLPHMAVSGRSFHSPDTLKDAGVIRTDGGDF